VSAGKGEPATAESTPVLPLMEKDEIVPAPVATYRYFPDRSTATEQVGNQNSNDVSAFTIGDGSTVMESGPVIEQSEH